MTTRPDDRSGDDLAGISIAWLIRAPYGILPYDARGVHGPDLVELGRLSSEVVNSGDLDAMVSFLAPDAVWDLSPVGMRTRTSTCGESTFADAKV
jgi:hypothetical protein